MGVERSLNGLSLGCTRVIATGERPGSRGTYIVRLSPASLRRLGGRDGAYVNVRCTGPSALARVVVDDGLDDVTIRMDQTIRMAMGLPAMIRDAERGLVIGAGLEGPVVVRLSSFRGPSLLAKLVGQQYLVCAVHVSMAEDMEKPFARLVSDSMDVIGVEAGDKVLLIHESEGKTRRKAMRCLPLPAGRELPLPAMERYFTRLRPEDPEGMHLPWIALDLQTRRDLGVMPWETLIVGRAPFYVLASSFGELAMALALGAVGGAVVLPDSAPPWLPLVIIGTGIFLAFVLTVAEIRSKL